MFSSLEKSSIASTKESATRFSLRAQLRKLSLGGMLLLSSSLSGCCIPSCGNTPSPTTTTDSGISLIGRYLSDAGRDAGIVPPPPPTTLDAGIDSGMNDASNQDSGIADAGMDSGMEDASVDASADVGIVDAAIVDGANVSDSGPIEAGVAIAIPQDQGTDAFRTERERCYRELPEHACVYDASYIARRTLHLIQLTPAISQENHLFPHDTDTTNNLACELVNAAGRPTFVMTFQHRDAAGDAYWTCDGRREGIDLRFHRLVNCVRHEITPSTPNPCTGR